LFFWEASSLITTVAAQALQLSMSDHYLWLTHVQAPIMEHNTRSYHTLNGEHFRRVNAMQKDRPSFLEDAWKSV
jgi:hypothetical protein